MTDTHTSSVLQPFIDDALLEQRQQQREVLLSIPKWLADEVLVDPSEEPVAGWPVDTPPAPPTDAQRLLIERHARDRVDDLLDHLQEGMVTVIDRGVAETIAAHLLDVLGHGPSPAARSWREDLTEQLMLEVAIDRPALGELVGLLLMADDLADDGFRDLRFTE